MLWGAYITKAIVIPDLKKGMVIDMLGYAFCGSFCTMGASIKALETLISQGYDVLPIMSENAYTIDTRFHRARDFRERLTELCGREIIHTVEAAEPLGPKMPLEALIIAPCTGNTLAKIANGITDGAVTMAAKAHMRQDRPLLIAPATNDGMSQNLQNIAKLICRRSVYIVPMMQDDPEGKPHSLVARMDMVPECLTDALRGKQRRPVFLA